MGKFPFKGSKIVPQRYAYCFDKAFILQCQCECGNLSLSKLGLIDRIVLVDTNVLHVIISMFDYINCEGAI